MKSLIKSLLITCLLLTPTSAIIADTTTPHPQVSTPVVIDGTEEVLFGVQQRNSRQSSVKVEGLNSGHGTGTYIEMNGHALVITARHVVDRAEIYYVSTAAGEKVVGQVIWKSQTKDIAVLKIPRLVSRVPVTLYRSNDLRIGDNLIYTGYPSSYELLTTRASVSGHTENSGMTLLQGFVWFGYSGSGAFDESGRLRAIVVGIGAEEWRGVPQLLETIVYTYEIEKKDITEIKDALER